MEVDLSKELSAPVNNIVQQQIDTPTIVRDLYLMIFAYLIYLLDLISNDFKYLILFIYLVSNSN
jgi:hypothetical protein